MDVLYKIETDRRTTIGLMVGIPPIVDVVDAAVINHNSTTINENGRHPRTLEAHEAVLAAYLASEVSGRREGYHRLPITGIASSFIRSFF